MSTAHREDEEMLRLRLVLSLTQMEALVRLLPLLVCDRLPVQALHRTEVEDDEGSVMRKVGYGVLSHSQRGEILQRFQPGDILELGQQTHTNEWLTFRAHLSFVLYLNGIN